MPVTGRPPWVDEQQRGGNAIFLQPVKRSGTSLAIQWLRLCLLVQGVWVQSLVWEPRSHMLCSLDQKKRCLFLVGGERGDW